MNIKLSVAAFSMVVALTATGVRGQTVFTGAVGDDYDLVGNWTAGVPTSGDEAQWGTTAYPSTSSTVYSGTSAEVALASIGVDTTASLTVEAGASLTTAGAIRVAADLAAGWTGPMPWDGPGGSLIPTNASGSLTVNGTASVGAGVSIGGYGPGTLTIGAGGTLSMAGSLFLAMDDVDTGWGGDPGYSADVTINTGGYMEVGNRTYMYYPDPANPIDFHLNGGTFTGNAATFLNRVNFEVSGQAEFNSPNDGTRFYSDEPGWITMKFSGTDPLLTFTGHTTWARDLVYLDVSELNLTTTGDWVTIWDNSDPRVSANPDILTLLVLHPATGPEWEMQLVDGGVGDAGYDVQVKYTPAFQLGDMDGSDGATEPNGNDINPFVMALVDRPAYEAAFPGLDADARGDAAQDDGLLNGNDINAFVDLLLNSGSQAVPEPASLSLLALGACLPLLRRRR